MSIRGTVRVTGVAKNTIVKLLADLGEAASEYQNGVLRNLDCRSIECDEIWSFCYAKQKNVPEQFQGTPGYGDVWTWVALDQDTRLVPTWLVGERTAADAYVFIADLRDRLRGDRRPQITTDGLQAYKTVIEPLFGAGGVDFATLHKVFGDRASDGSIERRYDMPDVHATSRQVQVGKPDMARVSTSYVERQNLSMRMGMRRFTRLSNGFSKKIENLAFAVSLHFLYYNFARAHSSLAEGRKKVTPAMAAGVARAPWSLTQIAGLLD